MYSLNPVRFSLDGRFLGVSVPFWRAVRHLYGAFCFPSIVFSLPVALPSFPGRLLINRPLQLPSLIKVVCSRSLSLALSHAHSLSVFLSRSRLFHRRMSGNSAALKDPPTLCESASALTPSSPVRAFQPFINLRDSLCFPRLALLSLLIRP